MFDCLSDPRWADGDSLIFYSAFLTLHYLALFSIEVEIFVRHLALAGSRHWKVHYQKSIFMHQSPVQWWSGREYAWSAAAYKNLKCTQILCAPMISSEYFLQRIPVRAPYNGILWCYICVGVASRQFDVNGFVSVVVGGSLLFAKDCNQYVVVGMCNSVVGLCPSLRCSFAIQYSLMGAF